jgi:2-hydroxychromene-2-carboxylate isomerase
MVMTDVTFFFDPRCPWTWRAARWLRTVARHEQMTIQWRSFDLALLREPDLDSRELSSDGATCALRLVEALRAADRPHDAGRLYEVLGEQVYERHQELDVELVRKVAAEVGLGDAADAVDDPTWDAAVRASLEAALDAAGPDIGSPVIVLAGHERGLHGPILASVPDERGSLDIWCALSTLLRCPEFYEVKRGRPAA